MNAGSNFFKGSFSNREMQEPQSILEEKSNCSISKDDFKDRPLYFHISSTGIWVVKWSNLNFPSIEINKPLCVSVHSIL